MTKRNVKKGRPERHIRVRSVRREPADLRKLAGAIIALAQAQAEAEAEAQTKEQTNVKPTDRGAA